ncbi:MAG: hypothetical protein AAF281_10595 [Pseudomonadota bacterium]
MELIADGLLIAAAATAALYCWVLSRRLTALRNLDRGLGGAIASLSAQVEETRSSLAEAKAATREQSRDLSDLTARAEVAAGRLEMMLAALHKGDSVAPVDADKVRKARRRPAAEPEARPARAETPPPKPEQPQRAAATLRREDTPAPAPAPEDPNTQGVAKAAPVPPPAPAQPAAERPAAQSAAEQRSELIARLRGLAKAAS